jgi:hypothetical protein
MNRSEAKHLWAWLPIPAMAVVNGGVRDLVYAKFMSETLAHSISVLPLMAAIAAWAWFLAGRWPLADQRAGLRIGLIWFVLTLTFELGLGALRGVELTEMLAQYDVTRGHLWPLVPLTMGLSPELARRFAARAPSTSTTPAV